MMTYKEASWAVQRVMRVTGYYCRLDRDMTNEVDGEEDYYIYVADPEQEKGLCLNTFEEARDYVNDYLERKWSNR